MHFSQRDREIAQTAYHYNSPGLNPGGDITVTIPTGDGKHVSAQDLTWNTARLAWKRAYARYRSIKRVFACVGRKKPRRNDMTNTQLENEQAPDTSDLIALIDQLLPLLNNNLEAAQKEYMAGEIPNGAFQYVLFRHSLAVAMLTSTLSHDPAQIPEYYALCAQITIDIETAVKDYPEGQTFLDRWLDLYRRTGFTEKHKFFDFPVMPEPADQEEKQKE